MVLHRQSGGHSVSDYWNFSVKESTNFVFSQLRIFQTFIVVVREPSNNRQLLQAVMVDLKLNALSPVAMDDRLYFWVDLRTDVDCCILAKRLSSQ